jgi:hypothetical protein
VVDGARLVFAVFRYYGANATSGLTATLASEEEWAERAAF